MYDTSVGLMLGMDGCSIRILSLIRDLISERDFLSLKCTCLTIYERSKSIGKIWVGIDVGEKSTSVVGIDDKQRVCLSREQLHDDGSETGDSLFDLVAFTKSALPPGGSDNMLVEVECQPAAAMQKMSHAIVATLYAIGWPRGSIKMTSATVKMSIEPSKDYLRITQEDIDIYERLAERDADRLKNKFMSQKSAYAAMTWVGDQEQFINLKLREIRKEQIHDWCDGYLFALARCWKDTECRIAELLKQRKNKKRRKDIPSGRFVPVEEKKKTKRKPTTPQSL
jgi:hypothetical protein